MSKAPLKLFWWNGKPNFGDKLSQLTVEYVSGRDVEWASEIHAEIFAIGSIMKQIRRNHNKPLSKPKPWIWGTGTVGSIRADFLPNVEFAAVRGPITASLVGQMDIPMGDPGLLVSELFDGKLPKQKSHSVGVILHHTQASNPHVDQFLDDTPNSIQINAATDDVEQVVSQVAACDIVMSSSLHGLIVADAVGVPNVWLNPAGIHGSPRFKFYDYATSIKRPLDPPVHYDALPGMKLAESDLDTSYFKNIDAVRDSIRNAFPEQLK